MAIEIDGKVYRNLPEQVEENANNIQYLLDLLTSMGSIMRYKGSVASYADLPTEDNAVGDVWNVIDTGANYAWDGEGWDEIGSSVDLSGYVQKVGIASEYDDTSTYAVGDIVYYQDNLYKCTTAIGTAEAWDPTHWTQIVLADEAVTLSKAQTITGAKTFTPKQTFDGGIETWQIIRQGIQRLYFDQWTSTVGSRTVLPLTASDDLGSSASKWKDLYLSGTAYAYGKVKLSNSSNVGYQLGNRGDGYLSIYNNNGNIVYDFDNLGLINRSGQDLGSSTYKWKDLYLSGAIYTSTIKTSSGANFIYYDGNNMAVFSETVRPNQDGTRDLGTSSYKWKDIYLSGNLSDGTNSISVASLAWKELSGSYVGYQSNDVIVASLLYRHQFSITDPDAFALLSGHKEFQIVMSDGTVNIPSEYRFYSTYVYFIYFDYNSTAKTVDKILYK